MVTQFLKRLFRTARMLVFRKARIESEGIPVVLENIPLRKLINWVLCEVSMFFKPAFPWALPVFFQIEPTNRCNLSCILCPVTDGLDRPAIDLDLTTFKRIVDETTDSMLVLYLWNWGEPFLNPSLYEMISYAKQQRIFVISSTNGHCFANMEDVDKLLASGLDLLTFSVDGISQNTYEKYRKGGNLSSVLDGIRIIVARKKFLGTEKPLINLRFIVMNHNEHEIPQLREFAESLGVDYLSLKTLNPFFEDPYAENRTEKLVNNFLPRESRYHRFLSEKNVKNVFRQGQNPCKALWNSMTINSSGTICSCCCDCKEKYALGNIKDSSVKTIWRSDSYRKMRRQFSTDWKGIGLCRSCTNAFEGGEYGGRIVSEVIHFARK
jgi:radical SAM protein with 4Fe4S-binding SPASM domain